MEHLFRQTGIKVEPFDLWVSHACFSPESCVAKWKLYTAAFQVQRKETKSVSPIRPSVPFAPRAKPTKFWEQHLHSSAVKHWKTTGPPQKRQPFNYALNICFACARCSVAAWKQKNKFCCAAHPFRRCSQEGAPKKKAQSIFFELFFPYHPLPEFSRFSRYIPSAFTFSFISLLFFSSPLPRLLYSYVHFHSHIHFRPPRLSLSRTSSSLSPGVRFFFTRFLYRSEPVERDCITSQRPNNAIWVPAAPGVHGGTGANPSLSSLRADVIRSWIVTAIRSEGFIHTHCAPLVATGTSTPFPCSFSRSFCAQLR